MLVSPSRRAAFDVLRRVAGGAFAADLLRADRTLSKPDAALAEELVLGVLRRQGQLDAWISRLTGGKLDAEVRLCLRLGLYQIGHLDRVPARAAVFESVELAKRARKGSAAGLVNAVLRKAAAGGAPSLEEPELAVPAWLLDRWRLRYGPQADRLALATLETPSTYLRLDPRWDPEQTCQLLAEEGVATEPTELERCARVRFVHPGETRCLAEGRCRIQDLGSQRIAPLLELRREHRFLDLCAAPGGKTLQALEANPGLAVACDWPGRVRDLRRRAPPGLHLVGLDATRQLPFAIQFDRILADVPCSGTGTLARNPEIKWKLEPADLADLADRQRAILGAALDRLAPGGRLVYSTCSLEPEENEEVVRASVRPPFECVKEHLWLPTGEAGDGFYAAVVERRVR